MVIEESGTLALWRQDTNVVPTEGLKMRRTWMVAKAEGESVINGQPKRRPQKVDGLLEAPVILSRNGEKWTAALEQGVPFENQKKDLEALEQAVNREPAFAAYGNTPRKPGDTWVAGLDAFSPEIFGEFAEVDRLEGSCTVTFVETKESKVMPCARLKVVLDLKGKLKGAGKGARSRSRAKARSSARCGIRSTWRERSRRR